jgi:hypothetical protein
MAAFLDGHYKMDYDEDARPNDPLYLMPMTSTPDPWSENPMFDAYGEPHSIGCKVGDKTHLVTVRFSIAKQGCGIRPRAPWFLGEDTVSSTPG